METDDVVIGATSAQHLKYGSTPMATSPEPLSEAKDAGKRTARIGRATRENALRRESADHPAVPTAGPTLEYPHTGYQPLSSAISLGGAFDRSLHAATARITMGLSPAALMAASMDWMINLASSPGRQMELIQEAAQFGTKFANYAMHCGAAPSTQTRCVEPSPHDKRFSGDGWQQWPYNLISQGFLLQEQWWVSATVGIRGLSKHHDNAVKFRRAADSGHALTVKQSSHQSGGFPADNPAGRHELMARDAKPY